MAHYLVGDIQGCLTELRYLLDRVHFSEHKDTLWFTGDLVARGKESLEVLRFVHQLGSAAKLVLGNHDLHLLAVAEGVAKLNPNDYTQAIYQAEDSDELFSWLRQQPLMLENEHFMLVHAGISPQWSEEIARAANRRVMTALQQEKGKHLLSIMYNFSPIYWRADLAEDDALRYIVNCFTRMRYCHLDGALELQCKLHPDMVDKTRIQPWFRIPRRFQLSKPVIFGHWAALNGINEANWIGLDTGCVWGNYMTLLRWEDKRYFVQPKLL